MKPQKRRRTPPSMIFEELEPRILHSADGATLFAAPDSAPQAEVRLLDAVVDTTGTAVQVADWQIDGVLAVIEAQSKPEPAASSAGAQAETKALRNEIVFVDAGVDDAERLLEELRASSNSDRVFEFVFLDGRRDGLAQIGETLAARSGIDAVHLLSHGQEGSIRLGASTLDFDSLLGNAGRVRGWGESLSEDADILIYGCDVAGSASGRSLIDALSRLTGADVAGSEDLTGSPQSGGDWDLEYATGSVDRSRVFGYGGWQIDWTGVLATYTVTNTNNTGAGSLRQAITNANSNAGADSITFNIAGTGIHTITLTSALPAILETVTIDATTDDSYAANGNRPAVIVSGGGTVADIFQLFGGSDGSTIRGFVLQNYTQSGINVGISNGNTIAGNWIGLNAAGTAAAGGVYGISLWNANNNVIGGATPADRNVISGNSSVGIAIDTDSAISTGNVVKGNYIGTNASGDAAVGNGAQGVWLNAASNTIGGTSVNEGNVIAGTTSWVGVQLEATASNTLIAGNYIGLNAAGTGALANAGGGIYLSSANNTIGGTTTAARNVISGNGGVGITLEGASATGNVVIGNYIGTDAAGTGDINGTTASGGLSGVVMDNGATNNRIGTDADGSNDAAERNVISGNNWYGVEMLGSGTSNNVVQGNYIGVDATGLVALGNVVGGVSFWNGASNNRVGGGLSGAGNVISGNETGVLVANGVTSNKVQGNIIGLGADGTTAVSNTGAGVYMYSGGSGSAVSGNVIGTDADGSNDSGERNIISSNFNGIVLADAVVTGNTIAGNYIGTDSTGLLDRGNSVDGVRVEAGANANTIGGSTATHRNIISGNDQEGVQIDGEASDNNLIRGNWIGVNASGNGTIGNGADGIFISSGADSTIVGGSAATQGNWIAGNGIVGIEVDGASTATTIQGNRIGTDLTGTLNWGHQQSGIMLDNGATNTLIGGASTAFGNIIAFSGQGGVWDDGIDVLGNTTTGNVILGNSIYGSVGLAIDLGNDGLDTIDVGDTDSGPNTRVNTLTLTSATTTGASVSLSGSYLGAANTYYRLEIFANTSTDDGEARTLIHTANMPVGAGGSLSATYSFSAAVAAGSKLTATVTRTNSLYSAFIETSEVSDLVVASAPNQAPSGSNGTMTATENLDYTFSGSEFGFTDADGDSLMRVWFDTLPGSGTLKFNGTPFAAGNWVAATDITNGLLTYTPASNVSGSGVASFTFRVQDDGGTTLGGSDTDASANTLTIDVTAVSSTPVNTVPGAQSTNEDTGKVFSTGNGNAISIVDVDAGGLDNQVTLSVSHGTLTLSGTTGLTFVAGDGTADATMTLRGLANDINAALNGLTYTPAANYNGADTLTVATQDAVLLSLDIDTSLIARYAFENSGALGTDSSPAAGFGGTVVNGTAVSDGTRGNVLGLSGNGYVQSTGHYGNPTDVTLAAWINLTTADTNGAEVISLGDSIAIRADSGGRLKGFYWDGTAFRFFETVTTLAGTGWRHVAVTFDDVNNVQKLYLDGSEVAATAFTGSIGYTLGADSVIGKHGNGVTTTDFTGRIDDARVYNRALTGGEIAALALDLGLVDTDTVALTVAAVNDPPTDLIALPSVAATDIIGSYSFNDATALGRDDAGNDAPMTLTGGVTQTTGPAGGGALALTGGQYGSIPGITSGGPMTLAGWARFDSTGAWQRVVDLGEPNSTGIGSIYVGRENTTNNLTFTVEVSGMTYRATADGAIANGTWMHFVATVDATGDMNLYVNGTLAAHGEGVVPTVGVRTNNYIGKSNWPDAPFDGAIDDLLIANGVMSAAQVAALYQQSTGLSVAENAANGTVVGTVLPVDADGTSPYTFTLVNSASGRFAVDNNGQITVADGTQLNYEAATSHNITVRVTDSGGQFYDEIFAVNVLNVNEAPGVTVPSAQTTAEDTPKIFSTANGNAISIADVDAGGANNEVTLSVSHGTLTLSGTAGLTFLAGDGTADASMTVRGTAVAINAALEGMAYTPTSEYSGSDTLTVTAEDSLQLALEIDANLAGRYPFDDSAADAAPGTAQDGTLFNGATYVTDGSRGRVLSLDGVNDYVHITGTFGNPSEVTIGGWVNLTTTGSRKEFISLSDRVHIALDDGGLGVKGSVQVGAGTWVDLVSNTSIGGTGWHHVMYTYSDSGDVHNLYIDGVKVATESIANSVYWTSATDTFIGRHPSGVNYADAKIDDVRIYDRALTANEVAALAVNTDLTTSASVALTITTVNDVPEFSNLNGTPSYTEGGVAVVLDNDVTVSDIELATGGNYSGATLTLARNGGANPQDQLVFDGVVVTTSGANVLVGGVQVGTYTFSGGQMDVSFDANATQARVNALLQNILYANSSDVPPGSVQIDWSFSDGNAGAQGSGGALTASGSTTVAITAANDSPTGAPSVTGTPTEDQTLTADTSAIADADGLGAFSYQWLRNGVAIAGATAGTYTLGDADVAANISVTVSYTDGQGSVESLTSAAVGPVASVNDAPTGAPSVAGTPTEDQTLTADTSAIADADGLGAFSYQWLRNGVAIAGATAGSYTLGDADVAANISVTVSYTDGQGTVESLTSAAVGPVASVNDAPTGAPSVTGTPTENQTLTADTSAIADADSLGAFSYQWLRNGVAIAGATAGTYTLDDADVGANISVTVSYTDGQGSVESLTSATVGPVASVNDAPTGAPSVTGTTTEDQTLTADTSPIADADGLGAFSYQWLRDGVAIAGATAGSYTLGDADVAANISVTVSYTDGQGTTESLTSAAVGPIANVNDAPTGAPSVTGTPTEDQTLTADTSAIADADGLGAFSYQWLRNGVAILGATASTHTLDDADVSANISVTVSYTDGQGTTESLTSAAVGPIASVNDAPTGAPSVAGTPTEDQTLTADTNAIADADGLGAFSYQWLRNGVAIAGATAGTYTLGDADVGASLSVTVNYIDSQGSAESLTSATVGPVANINDAPTGVAAITGTPTEHQTLTADTTGLGDDDGLGSYGYQWLRNGVAVSGETAATYVLTAADIGATIAVQVDYVDGHGTSEILTSAGVGPVANFNDVPTGTPTVTGVTTEDQTLTADTSAIADADGLGAFSYQWLRNGVAIAGATAGTYTLGDADVGANISVTVSYTDGQGTTESLTSATVGPVGSVNDAPTGAPSVTGTPTEDQTLTADTSAIADADGLGAFSYQWLRNGVAIAGATAGTYTLDDADVGANISVTVSYTDGQGSVESLTSATVGPVANVNDGPTGAPTVSGVTTEDQTLTADTSAIADADGLGAFSYQWLRNGVAIAGATAGTYTLGDADVSANISVTVSYTDGQGTTESLTSAAVGPVTSVNDTPTGAPTVSGVTTEDQTLTADTSAIADADGLGAFSYQWLRNGVAIAGATAGTYTLGDADVAANISVTVSYNDGQGTTESLTSATVGPVASVNDTPTGAPTVSGVTTEDQTLTADTSAIADADGLGAFSYQWLRNGVAIAGATAGTYTLDDADVGSNISVTVSYTDAQGTTESLTSAAVGPVVNVNDAPTGSPVIAGLATEDQVLSVDASAIGDADGLGTFSYQWLRDGLAIAGATGTTYTLGDIDVGANITVQVDYVDGQGTSESLTSAAVGPIANINDAPQIVSDGGGPNATVTLAENISAVTSVAAVDIDVPANTLTYSIIGGADQSLFSMDPNTGALIFNVAPDAEAPGDADGDNVYHILLQVDDGNGGTDTQALSIAVTDVNEFSISVLSDANVESNQVTQGAANGTVVGVTAFAQDADRSASVSYALTDDAGGRFAIDATTGVITLANTALLDAALDSAHIVQVLATSTDGSATTMAVTITVNPPPVVIDPVVDPTPAPDPNEEPPPSVVDPELIDNPAVTVAPVEDPQGVNTRLSKSIDQHAEDLVLAPQADGSASAERAVAVGGTAGAVAWGAEGRQDQRVRRPVFRVDGTAFLIDKLGMDWRVTAMNFLQEEWLGIDGGSQLEARFEESGGSEDTGASITVAASAKIGGAIASAGVVAWVLRSGGLLTSLLVSTPAWRHIDPIPVLAPEEDKPDWGGENDREGDREERAALRLFRSEHTDGQQEDRP